jgi:Glycosyl transferases group 1
MRLLVIDRGTALGSPEGHQAIPFQMYRDDLARRLGVIVDQVTCLGLDEIEEAIESRPADAVLIHLSWRVTLEESVDFLQRLNDRPRRPRIILMDYLAPAGSPFLSLIPYVDCYVKRQHLADVDLYAKDYEGGQVFTDFLAKELGYDLDGWNFGTKPDPAHLGKLVTGWNLGVTPRYHRQLRLTRRFRSLWRMRPFDVHRRFSPASDGKKFEWYERYRQEAAQKLDGLADRYRLTGSGRIHHRLYLGELLASKLVVSPFGWGEVCFRDYEAVATGSLLVKPSMDHLVTLPNIYKPYETYVPVKWDLSDLAETCDHYLRHPSESLQIIRNAQEALLDYYENDGFVNGMRHILDVATRSQTSAVRV